MAFIITCSLMTLKPVSSTYLLGSWFKHPTEYFNLYVLLQFRPNLPRFNDSSPSSPHYLFLLLCFPSKWISQPFLPSSLIYKLGSHLVFLFPLLHGYIKKLPNSINYTSLIAFKYHLFSPSSAILFLIINTTVSHQDPLLHTCLYRLHSCCDTIHSSIHLFNKNFLGTYYVPGSALGSGFYLVFSVTLAKCKFDHVSLLFQVL